MENPRHKLYRQGRAGEGGGAIERSMNRYKILEC